MNLSLKNLVATHKWDVDIKNFPDMTFQVVKIADMPPYPISLLGLPDLLSIVCWETDCSYVFNSFRGLIDSHEVITIDINLLTKQHERVTHRRLKGIVTSIRLVSTMDCSTANGNDVVSYQVDFRIQSED